MARASEGQSASLSASSGCAAVGVARWRRPSYHLRRPYRLCCLRELPCPPPNLRRAWQCQRSPAQGARSLVAGEMPTVGRRGWGTHLTNSLPTSHIPMPSTSQRWGTLSPNGPSLRSRRMEEQTLLWKVFPTQPSRIKPSCGSAMPRLHATHPLLRSALPGCETTGTVARGRAERDVRRGRTRISACTWPGDSLARAPPRRTL